MSKKRKEQSPLQEQVESIKRISLNRSPIVMSEQLHSSDIQGEQALTTSEGEQALSSSAENVNNNIDCSNSASALYTPKTMPGHTDSVSLAPPSAHGSGSDLNHEFVIPEETPAWAKVIYNQIWSKLSACETNCTQAMSVNSNTNAAMADMKEKIFDTFDMINVEIEELQKVNRTLKEKVLRQELYSRLDNLIVSGIPERSGERNIDCRRKCLRYFQNYMNIDVSNIWITRCHRIGRYNRSSKSPRKIIIRFHYYCDREYIWENRRMLHGSNIFLSEDFPDEILQRRKQLWPAYQAAKKLPKYKGKCTLVEDALVIRGQYYRVNDIPELPEDIHPWYLSEKRDANTVAFFTRSNPMSNHFPAPVTVENTRYNCNEQYIMAKKAELFEDFDAEEQIMNSTNPVQQKAIGRRVKDFDYEQWKLESPRIAYKVVHAKFTQHSELANWLVSTGERTIVEASPDKLWGVGLKLSNPEILNPSAWGDSINCMGQALMKVRDEIKKKRADSLITPLLKAHSR